jgi:hypothetical protein
LDSTGKANRLLDVHMIPTPPRYDVLQLLGYSGDFMATKAEAFS